MTPNNERLNKRVGDLGAVLVLLALVTLVVWLVMAVVELFAVSVMLGMFGLMLVFIALGATLVLLEKAMTEHARRKP